MSTFVNSTSSTIASAIVPIVTTAITLWALLFGLAAMRGETHEPIPAFAWRGTKIALIMAVALSGGIYQSQVVGAVNGVAGGLAQVIAQSADNGGACTASVATDTSIYTALDCYDQKTDTVVEAYYTQAVHDGAVLQIVAAIGELIGGTLVGLAAGVFMIVLAGEVVVARVGLDLVLALGPAFIACAAFSPSARFFDAWVSKVAYCVVLQVLIAAFLAMALAAYSQELNAFVFPGGGTGTGSTSIGQSALAWLGAATGSSTGTSTGATSDGNGSASLNAIASALGLVVTTLLLAWVGLKLHHFAAALAGGSAGVSGVGAFIAGFAMRRFTRAMQTPVTPSSGGAITPSTPAYRRAAEAHLGRHT
jgi:type IV secretion system protein VirB6